MTEYQPLDQLSLPLETHFSFFYDHHSEKLVDDSSWKAKIAPLTARPVETVRDFLNVLNCVRVSELCEHSNFYMFKSHIRPDWDSEVFVRPATATAPAKAGYRVKLEVMTLAPATVYEYFALYNFPAVSDEAFCQLFDRVAASIVGQDMPHSQHVAGAVVQRRRPVRRIHVWLTADATDQEAADVGAYLSKLAHDFAVTTCEYVPDKTMNTILATRKRESGAYSKEFTPRDLPRERPVLFTDLEILDLKANVESFLKMERTKTVKPGRKNNNRN